MKFTQDQKARFFSNIIKFTAVLSFAAVLGVLAYNLAVAEQRGRQRALQYEKEKGKKKPKSLLPDQLQPEFIEKQRRKYRPLVQNKSEQI